MGQSDKKGTNCPVPFIDLNELKCIFALWWTALSPLIPTLTPEGSNPRDKPQQSWQPLKRNQCPQICKDSRLPLFYLPVSKLLKERSDALDSSPWTHPPGSLRNGFWSKSKEESNLSCCLPSLLNSEAAKASLRLAHLRALQLTIQSIFLKFTEYLLIRGGRGGKSEYLHGIEHLPHLPNNIFSDRLWLITPVYTVCYFDGEKDGLF